MKNRKITVWVLIFAGVCCFGSPKCAGTIVYDDGGIHNLNEYINDSIEVRDSSSEQITTVNLLSNYVFGRLYAYDNSRVTMSGGFLRNPDSGMYAYDYSQVIISGGYIGWGVEAEGNSHVTVSGGSIIHALRAVGNSHVTVSGGSLGNDCKIYAGIYPSDDSTMTIVGSNFAINGKKVANGIFNDDDWVFGNLTGTLADGHSLNETFYIYGNSTLVLIPEPATLLLLGLGAVMLRRKNNDNF
jgi:hypothetical protein